MLCASIIIITMLQSFAGTTTSIVPTISALTPQLSAMVWTTVGTAVMRPVCCVCQVQHYAMEYQTALMQVMKPIAVYVRHNYAILMLFCWDIFLGMVYCAQEVDLLFSVFPLLRLDSSNEGICSVSCAV